MGGPVINIQASDGSNLVDFVTDLSVSFDDVHKGTTKFTITDTVTGHSLSIIGGGFTYSGGTLTGGTANAIQINDGGNHYAKIDNFNLDAGDVASAFLGGHPTNLFDLFGFSVFEGNQGPDTIEGGSGNEILRGNQGDDTLIGGHGADTLDGGGDLDAASYENANKGVHANLSDPSNNTHDAQGDSYVSIESLLGTNFDDKLTGTNHDNSLAGFDGNDTLRGRNGGDVLYGGDGDDVVIGGQGGDSMYGGTGADQFNFLESETTASLVGAHSINDWDNHDVLAVDAASFGHGLTAGVALTGAQFHVDSAPVGTNGQFLYNTSADTLLWDDDGTGGHASVVVVFFSTNVNLSSSDIVVI